MTPGRLLASRSGPNLTGSKPLFHDTVAGPLRGVVVVVVVVVAVVVVVVAAAVAVVAAVVAVVAVVVVQGARCV